MDRAQAMREAAVYVDGLDCATAGADAERTRVVAWLRGQMHRSWAMADGQPWWWMRLRFANRVAATVCNLLADWIERGEHWPAPPKENPDA